MGKLWKDNKARLKKIDGSENNTREDDDMSYEFTREDVEDACSFPQCSKEEK